MRMFDRTRRSEEVTQHDCGACPSCRGGSHNHVDHYELGKLRLRVGAALGLDQHTTQQLDLRSLMQRHQETGSPALGEAK